MIKATNMTRTVAGASAVNFVGAVLPLVAALVTIPLFISTIGEARYGALAIIWTILNYFVMLDLGLGRGVANRVAQLESQSEAARSGIFWQGLLLSGAFGAIGILLAAPLISLCFRYVLDVEQGLSRELVDSVPFLLASIPLVTITSILLGALEGRKAFVALNIGKVVILTLSMILPLLVALAGYVSLFWLVLGILAGYLIGSVFLLLKTLSQLPVLRPQGAWWHGWIGLLKYGGWITVSAVLGPILTVIDRFIIGALLGMTSVAAYVIPYQLVTRLWLFPRSVATAVFPHFSSRDQAHSQELLHHTELALTSLLTPIVVMALLFSEPFLRLWLGESLGTRATPVALVLLLGVWINALATGPHEFLRARGRPDLPAKFHALEVIPYLVLLWFAITHFGIVGAAVAWTARVAADTILHYSAIGMLGLLIRRQAGSYTLTLLAFALAVVSLPVGLRIGLGTLLVILATFRAIKDSPPELANFVRKSLGAERVYK